MCVICRDEKKEKKRMLKVKGKEIKWEIKIWTNRKSLAEHKRIYKEESHYSYFIEPSCSVFYH